MIVHPATWWQYIAVGTVVLIDGVPRRVIANGPIHPTFPHDERVVLLEGCPPPPGILGVHLVQPVTLDDTDAMATLAAAGLNPEVLSVTIEEE